MIHTLVESLRCPETRQKLSVAGPELVARLNRQIAAGQVRNRGGQRVTRELDGGFMREDGRFLYPVHGRLPIMLIDEAIPLDRGEVVSAPLSTEPPPQR